MERQELALRSFGHGLQFCRKEWLHYFARTVNNCEQRFLA
jgi:hypothetical protein